MKQHDPDETLRRELEALRAEHQLVLSSTSYRLGRLLTRAIDSPAALFRLPLDMLRLAREAASARRPSGPDSADYQTISNNWDELAERIRKEKIPDVVFLFSGTTHIQDTRGNRPIRQTQALLARGTPVFFSYHRSRNNEELPPSDIAGLVQSPVDITMQMLDRIARTNLGEAKKLFIISYPYPQIEKAIDLFRQQGWAIIYDCRDDWEEFAKVGMARWFDAKIEQQIVAETDRTFCVSMPLVEKMRRLAPGSRVELMPNAVEADFLPADYRRMPSLAPRIIGYFGHLSPAWFDWEALAKIARSRPQYRFEVIGHSAPPLSLPENVVLPGPKPWHELHHHCASWSVAIIPFRMGPLADGVDPIKIYEYLAFGHPVVSFRMPQISNYPYTQTVETVADFCDALDKAVALTPDQKIIDAFLARNTWEVRAAELLSVMDS